MKLLEKIFTTNLHVSGIENIPDTPVLFVANHFTRAETFIVPHLLYKTTKRKVRSLADDTIFVGALGKYLKSMGTLSTDDPKRNKIILGDLMTGRRDWLIYPEGIMVKNHHVTHNSNYIIHKEPLKRYRVKTGSATLAIQAELLKKQYLQAADTDKAALIEKFRDEYFIGDDIISPQNLHIVPVTIDYHPVRPGENSIYNVTQKFIKALPARIREELEIEGNLVTNSEVIVKFNPAINVYEYLKNKRRLIHKLPFVSEETKNSLVINYFRYRLTNRFMRDIYNNLQLNMDHIFAASCYYIQQRNISEEHLKQLIYLNAREIRKLGNFRLHPQINNKLINIFRTSQFNDYEASLKLALQQDILSKEQNGFKLNHAKFSEYTAFHQVRVENTLQIFVNQLLKFPELTKIFKMNARLSAQELQKNVFATILRSDQKEHADDYQKYFDAKESKTREQGQPFFLENKKSNIGIVLAHGYKAAPEEVRILAEYLHQAGFNVYAVRLKGHGTAPINLKYTKWQDWYDSFFKGFAALRLRCDKVFLAGFSTGGLLALLTAARTKHKIAGVISINSAIKLRDIRVNLVPTVHFWNELLTKFKAEKGKKEFIIDTPENPKINYAKNYLKGVKELSDLMDECNAHLGKVKVPTLIIQATNDPVVSPKSGTIIHNKIAAKRKKLITPDFDNHVIIREHQPELFAEIEKFIKKST